MTRQDNTWQDTTKQDKTRQDYTIQEKTRQDQCKSRQNKTRQERARQDKTHRTRQTFVVYHGPSVFQKPHAAKFYVVFCFIRQIHDGSLISSKLEPRSYVLYLSEAFLFWRAWHFKCRIRQICGKGVQQLFTAWHCFEAEWTRYFSRRTNSWEISSFSAGKKSYFCSKPIKHRLREKVAAFLQSACWCSSLIYVFLPHAPFFLPLRLIFSRIRHLYCLHPAHMLTQEAKLYRVHMLFYLTHNMHPASGNDVSSPSKNLAGQGFFSPNSALGWRIRNFGIFKVVEPAKKRTVLQPLKQCNVESGIQMMHLELFCCMRHFFA